MTELFTIIPATNALGLLFKEGHNTIYEIIRQAKDIGYLHGRRKALEEANVVITKLEHRIEELKRNSK